MVKGCAIYYLELCVTTRLVWAYSSGESSSVTLAYDDDQQVEAHKWIKSEDYYCW